MLLRQLLDSGSNKCRSNSIENKGKKVCSYTSGASEAFGERDTTRVEGFLSRDV